MKKIKESVRDSFPRSIEDSVYTLICNSTPSDVEIVGWDYLYGAIFDVVEISVRGNVREFVLKSDEMLNENN